MRIKSGDQLPGRFITLLSTKCAYNTASGNGIRHLAGGIDDRMEV